LPASQYYPGTDGGLPRKSVWNSTALIAKKQKGAVFSWLLFVSLFYGSLLLYILKSPVEEQDDNFTYL
jgi:hypothetical protein